VGPLSHTILMRLSPDSVLELNTLVCKELLLSIGHPLSTLVIPDSLHLSTSVSLQEGFVLLESREGIRLLLERHNAKVSGLVINESDPVLIALRRLQWDGSMQVSVSDIKQAC